MPDGGWRERYTVNSVITHTVRDKPWSMGYYRVWVLGERNGCKPAFWDTEMVWAITEYGLYPVWVITESTVLSNVGRERDTRMMPWRQEPFYNISGVRTNLASFLTRWQLSCSA
jgi:hypothetical protein